MTKNERDFPSETNGLRAVEFFVALVELDIQIVKNFYEPEDVHKKLDT